MRFYNLGYQAETRQNETGRWECWTWKENHSPSTTLHASTEGAINAARGFMDCATANRPAFACEVYNAGGRTVFSAVGSLD